MEYIAHKCTNCGGQLEIKNDLFVCKSCGSSFSSDQLKKKMFVDLRLAEKEIYSANFSKAKKILNKIINDNKEEDLSEVYWNLMLSSNTIMFETDGKGEQFPSFFNVTETNILESEEYKKAIEYAQNFDEYDKIEIYRRLAEKIEVARKKYLDISKKTNPFDIFICFKSTDENGNSTKDKQLATDIYNELNGKYKVFFSEKTLQNIKSSYRDYEPNIYYGLYTSKVMLLICSKKEYLESTWLKNEWSRFEKINATTPKVIIPIFTDDFNPNDLPQELWHKQGIKDDIKLIDSLNSQLASIIKPEEELAKIQLKQKQRKKKIIIGSLCLVGLLCVVGIVLMTMKSKVDEESIHYKLINGSYTVTEIGKNYRSEIIEIKGFYNDIEVTAIEPNAFKNVPNTTQVIIPETITNISVNAFAGLDKLEILEIPFVGSSQTDTESSFLGYFFGAENYLTNNEKVPATLHTVKITNDPVISSNTFYGLTNIKEIHISKNTQTIESSAFAECKMQTLELPFVGKTVNSYSTDSTPSASELFGYIFGATRYEYQWQDIPSSLKNLILTKQEIFGNYSFYKVVHLETITIPETTRKFGTSAFNSCKKIKTVYYNGTMENWGSISFVSEKSNPLYYSGVDKVSNKKFYEMVNGEYKLVEKLEISSNSFASNSIYGYDCIKEIVIKENVTQINKNVFRQLNSLTSFTFENSSNWFVYTTNVENAISITITNKLDDMLDLIEQYYNYIWIKN